MARQWSATPSTAVRIRSIPQETHFNSGFCIFVTNRKVVKNLTLVLIFVGNICFAQCDYTLLNLENVNCYGTNTGSIDISVNDNNSTFWWTSNNGYYSNNQTISNLYSGSYAIHIMQNQVPGDTSTALICYEIDTIIVEQTLAIKAIFEISNLCLTSDSADVSTNIIGGTPPYTTQWSNGDTSRNAQNLKQNNTYTLNIVDANFCSSDQFLYIPIKNSIGSYMSSTGAICKDDDNGDARVFVTNGSPPFEYEWSNEIVFLDENNSASRIEMLSPGWYSVQITDAYGCKLIDSVEVKTNPKKCLKFYKVFSPNDDIYNPIWNIENIEMYPNAVIEIYSRSGEQVFRRRNYQNSFELGFSGNDKNGDPLPSATYYYIIDLSNEDQILKGAITIVR